MPVNTYMPEPTMLPMPMITKSTMPRHRCSLVSGVTESGDLVRNIRHKSDFIVCLCFCDQISICKLTWTTFSVSMTKISPLHYSWYNEWKSACMDHNGRYVARASFSQFTNIHQSRSVNYLAHASNHTCTIHTIYSFATCTDDRMTRLLGNKIVWMT